LTATSSLSARPPAIANTLVQAAVRLDVHGNVLTSRGEGQELVGAVTYSARVAQLIAESLGLGELKSIEYETERYKAFIHRENDGQLLAVRANRDVDLSRIKDKLGL
jgi:predicted regulator of Ras-like GTPase activity (Roadblock/LC7/MglB family)